MDMKMESMKLELTLNLITEKMVIEVDLELGRYVGRMT